MENIVFSWNDYLQRDVSLFEEVGIANPRLLMKYVYPDSLRERLPKQCRKTCFHLTKEIQSLHRNFYDEEALDDLYVNKSMLVNMHIMAKFIKTSLFRLLQSKEKPWHPLFTRDTIYEIKKFFLYVLRSSPDETISLNLEVLRRPIVPSGKRWGELTESLMTEVQDSQAKFLFHYFFSYIRKFLVLVEEGESLQLRLRPKEEVISLFTQKNPVKLFSELVEIPKMSDFYVDKGSYSSCLVYKCAVSKDSEVAEVIMGSSVFNALEEESQADVLKMTKKFIKKHRNLCTLLASKDWRNPKPGLQGCMQILVDRLIAMLHTSFRSLYTRFNLEAASRHLMKAIYKKISNENLFKSISIDFNPEPIEFIDSLCTHIQARYQKNASEYQQALFYNSMFFYYRYIIHWARRAARFEDTRSLKRTRYIFKLRNKKEIENLFAEVGLWADKCKVDDENPDNRGEEEPGPSSSTVHSEISPEEIPSQQVNPLDNSVSTKRIHAKSAEVNDEVLNHTDAVKSPEKKEKKRKKRQSTSEDTTAVEDVASSTKSPPKKKKEKLCDIVELSSDDDEVHMLSDELWETKWNCALKQLSSDRNVPFMACLTLNTVIENNRRLRLELKKD